MADGVGEHKLYYGVANGKKPGIYTSWGLCYKHTNKVPGILFKGFSDIDDCIDFMVEHSSVEKADVMVYEDGRSKGRQIDEFVEELSNIMSEVRVNQDNGTVMLIHPILSYIAYSLNSGTIELIKQAVAGYFTSDDICEAKDLIFTKCDEEVIGVKKSRRVRDGDFRSKANNDVMDIIEALNKLDAAGKTPDILIKATDLHLIPRSKPEELQSISLVDRVRQMEENMKRMQESIDNQSAVSMSLDDRVANIEKGKSSYAAIARRNAQAAPVTRPKPSAVTSSVNPAALASSGNVHKNRQYSVVDATKGLNRLRRGESTTSLVSNASSNPSEYNEGFRYQGKQRKKTRPKPVTGTRTVLEGGFKGAPAPSRDIFVYRVEKDTPDNVIKDYIVTYGIEVRSVVCLSSENATFSSFKVVISVSDLPKVLDPEFWPTGVCVRRLYAPREPRQTVNHGSNTK